MAALKVVEFSEAVEEVVGALFDQAFAAGYEFGVKDGGQKAVQVSVLGRTAAELLDRYELRRPHQKEGT